MPDETAHAQMPRKRPQVMSSAHAQPPQGMPTVTHVSDTTSVTESFGAIRPSRVVLGQVLLGLHHLVLLGQFL